MRVEHGSISTGGDSHAALDGFSAVLIAWGKAKAKGSSGQSERARPKPGPSMGLEGECCYLYSSPRGPTILPDHLFLAALYTDAASPSKYAEVM
jgi:hypothetical protein